MAASMFGCARAFTTGLSQRCRHHERGRVVEVGTTRITTRGVLPTIPYAEQL